MRGPRESRQARRTERYLDALLAADGRGALEVPSDADLDPGIRLAARRLRADLLRVHPSFQFEDRLAGKLGVVALRLKAGLPIEGDAGDGRTAGVEAPTQFPAGPRTAASAGTEPPAGGGSAGFSGAASFAHRPSMPSMPAIATKPSRPLLVGGVASAALSIGAVYVAWRWSHPSGTPMSRAVRAARSGRNAQVTRAALRAGASLAASAAAAAATVAATSAAATTSIAASSVSGVAREPTVSPVGHGPGRPRRSSVIQGLLGVVA